MIIIAYSIIKRNKDSKLSTSVFRFMLLLKKDKNYFFKPKPLNEMNISISLLIFNWGQGKNILNTILHH